MYFKVLFDTPIFNDNAVGYGSAERIDSRHKPLTNRFMQKLPHC
jgi:hypothetical protein